MYNNVEELLALVDEQTPLHKAVINTETELTNATETEIYGMFSARYDVMLASITKALDDPQQMPANLISGQSSIQYQYSKGNTLSGKHVNRMMAMALSASEVNASMGRICASPTAGACGILPAVITMAAKRLNSSKEEILNALIVSSAFGAIITKNATVSGAEGGCQAECGTAAAMAASAAVYLAGGSAKQCADAVSIALVNCMGLICDPVAGLVQMPCSFRNASQSANAITSADMALAGQKCPIPTDEVIEAMYRVGKKLPSEMRETAQGGIAATPTAKKIAKAFLESDKN